MTRGDKVRLSDAAILQLVDPTHAKSTGTVVSNAAGLVLVRWDDTGRAADYGPAWLEKIPGRGEVAAPPAPKVKLDTTHARRWK